MLLASTQALDVRAMRPEDERRNDGAHDEQRRLHTNGHGEKRGEHDRRDEAAERDVPGGEHHGDEDAEGHEHRHRREGEEHAGSRRDALAALPELEEEWSDMTGDGCDADGNRPHDWITRALDARRQQQHWQRTLRGVSEKHRDADLPAEHTKHVRGAEVAGALLAQVHALRESGKVREGNGSRHVRQGERRCRMHVYASAFAPLLRRMRMRSGLPVNGYVSRNPLWRKRM